MTESQTIRQTNNNRIPYVPAAETDKYEWIDIARAIAILMVIALHTSLRISKLSPLESASLAYGQMGVQMFFVASAVTLCMSARSRRGERFQTLSFYARRFFRIAPLYYFGIAAYYCIHLALPHTTSLGRLSAYTPFNVACNVLFIHGFVPSANNVIVPGGWSIATEMTFYLMFPPLFWLMEKIGAWRIAFTLSSILACFGITSMITNATFTTFSNNSFIYYSILAQLPVFLIGMLAFFAIAADKQTPTRTLLMGFLLTTGLTLILWHSKRPNAFFFVAPSAALSFSVLLILLSKTRFPLSSPLAEIGRRSYSMYICHFFFAFVIGSILKDYLTKSPSIKFAIEFALICTLSYSLSFLTQRTIERGGISLGRNLISRLAKTTEPNARLTRGHREMPPDVRGTTEKHITATAIRPTLGR